MKQYLAVGYVQRPHALKGELTVEPLTDNMGRFAALKNVYVESNGKYVLYSVEHARAAAQSVLVKLAGVDTIEAADAFRSQYLYVARADAAPLGEGEYYYADIIGCRAVMSDNGSLLGTVYDIISTPNNDVYCVKTPKGEEICLPVMKRFITVDIEHDTIYVNREGLEEIVGYAD